MDKQITTIVAIFAQHFVQLTSMGLMSEQWESGAIQQTTKAWPGQT
jgi:hypothetical protein